MSMNAYPLFDSYDPLYSKYFDCLEDHSFAPSYRFADMFAGLGGFHLAFHALGATCVLASEINPSARKVYTANFEQISPRLFSNGWYGDIAECVNDAANLPDFDVLCGGFPCQPFSIAGKRKGMEDPRGGMFDHLGAILRLKRPRAYFFENVQGLLSSNGGDDLRFILKSIAVSGYSCQFAVLRACDFGLPQFRPRVLFVGFSCPDIPFRFPDPVPLTMSMSDVFGGRCHRRIGNTILSRKPDDRMVDEQYGWANYVVNGKKRKITSREARIMQGFPDWYCLDGVSETQRMRLLGNSVAVPMIQAVALNVLRSLEVGRMMEAEGKSCWVG